MHHDWSPQQVRALDAVGRWLKSRDKPFFYLAGYAGTGKTTLAVHLAEGVNGLTLFAAFTGKAASVMQEKGCIGAKTIHSLIYRTLEKSHSRLRRLVEELAAATSPQARRDLEEMILEEKRQVKQPAFELNSDSALSGASLLVIDECSMIGPTMGCDILSFGTPVLVLGDPFQLPPVRGAGHFTGREPDALLTEIHRQGEGSPIIDLATQVREGGTLAYGQYGDSSVLRCGEFKREEAIRRGAQVIVGKNDTRRRANTTIRSTLGFSGDLPSKGDRLVCLRNNHEWGLLNGTIWTVDDAPGDPDECGRISLVLRDDQSNLLCVDAHAGPFVGGEVDPMLRREAEEFDFGYALTCHKAQGSQWDDVVVVDESRVFRQDANRWLYTAITRAKDRVTVVR